MGGNIFKDLTSRVTREQYRRARADILLEVRTLFPGTRVKISNGQELKLTHGDIDVIIESTRESGSMGAPERLISKLNGTDISRNGPFISFPMPVDDIFVQVDLIYHSPENFETAAFYYGATDQLPFDGGNILGRIFHKQQLKFGHDGLTCVLRDGNYQFAVLTVSKDPKKTLEFIGLDYDRTLSGFESRKEFYAFVTTSPFFNPEIYAYENRNHTARVRDKKRESYREFLEYLETRKDDPTLNRYPYRDKSELGGRFLKDLYLERVRGSFPEFGPEYERAVREHDLHLEFKSKFNGGLVQELTGLVNQELGEFMKTHKSEEFKRFVLESTQEEVNDRVRSDFQNFKKETR